MTATATGEGGVSAAVRWLHGLWEYYREYTQTAVHAASAAALTAFGLLIFVNRLFVLLAIASYVLPPILLYSLDWEIGKTTRRTSPGTKSDRTDFQTRANAETGANIESRRDADTRGDTGSSRNGGDTDSDSDDGDTDSDSDDGDTDSDSDDGDTDSDG
jgi:hypothetical protein